MSSLISSRLASLSAAGKLASTKRSSESHYTSPRRAGGITARLRYFVKKKKTRKRSFSEAHGPNYNRNPQGPPSTSVTACSFLKSENLTAPSDARSSSEFLEYEIQTPVDVTVIDRGSNGASKGIYANQLQARRTPKDHPSANVAGGRLARVGAVAVWLLLQTLANSPVRFFERQRRRGDIKKDRRDTQIQPAEASCVSRELWKASSWDAAPLRRLSDPGCQATSIT